MDVSVIIVSYNTTELTRQCLTSLQEDGCDKEVFVVDNASADSSVGDIRRGFPDVQLIANTENRGFGPANNQALKLCRGRYIVFLNPDATVKKDTLEKAISFMDRNPKVGLAGAKILNPDGSLQESISWRYPGEKYASGETNPLAGDIACVLGAFMIAPQKLLIELGGFDEDFFLYGEDQDLAWRIREKGFSIGFIPDAEAYHWGAKSEAATPRPALFEKKLRAEYLFYSKHYCPHTIEKIRRAQRRKARYRLVTLMLFAPFVKNREAHFNKVQSYRIALRLAGKQGA